MAKKYSFNDRIKYHSSRVEELGNKCRNPDGSISSSKWSSLSKNPKYQFSLGYEQVISRGRPLNFDERSAAYKRGCIAAENAKKKAYSKKF